MKKQYSIQRSATKILRKVTFRKIKTVLYYDGKFHEKKSQSKKILGLLLLNFKGSFLTYCPAKEILRRGDR